MPENNSLKTWLYYFLLGAIVGAIAETAAYLLNWWILNPRWFFIPWFFIWEGACFGSLAFLTRKLHFLVQYGISAAVGGTGEVIAAWIYPLWTFPGESLLFLKGLPAIVIALTIIWGFICPIMSLIINKFTNSE